MPERAAGDALMTGLGGAADICTVTTCTLISPEAALKSPPCTASLTSRPLTDWMTMPSARPPAAPRVLETSETETAPVVSSRMNDAPILSDGASFDEASSPRTSSASSAADGFV